MKKGTHETSFSLLNIHFLNHFKRCLETKYIEVDKNKQKNNSLVSIKSASGLRVIIGSNTKITGV